MGGVFHTEPAELPILSGAYVLIVELATETTVLLPKRQCLILPKGRYLYCGSAQGPGGINARVARHMRRDKPIRWHIDQLTSAGRVIGSWVFPGGNECELVRSLSALPVPIPGFGSSDCRRCASHLLACPVDCDPQILLRNHLID
ncbi:MAG: GIY-YIG nuclease family protein [Alphaproteobacteria bacterium]|nr:GIY-YIG nuclease family protein [Alphaproteobacteria bacterium]